ncbi:MAG: Asp23/Gls24 family envelope stress response protein [Synergistaceae bacterium]|nr:Asp23/Gls24 family envelope stress response protein [Synergistaceae bacterium]
MAEYNIIENIKTYAFVGAAGTGKSQRAQLVASLMDADYIIDDGLVIHKGSIVCGRSAKSERNQVSAIRRALFEFDDHRREVIAYFRSVVPCSLMVIATSDNMAERILRKLQLPMPEQIVHIEDVASPEEILKARRERFSKGQHVIPVSHVLVRKNFAGKLVGQLRVFWKSKDRHEGEKTIVRPPFSFFGEVHIETEALEELTSFIAGRTAQVSRVNEVKVTPEDEEAVSIEIKLTVTAGGKNFISVANLVRERIAVSLRYFTGLDVKTVDVVIAEVLI